jgi:hypothetical protein
MGALNLYNYDYDTPENKNIISLIDIGVATVSKKSAVYKKLSEHYRRLGNKDLMERYLKMAKQQIKREH